MKFNFENVKKAKKGVLLGLGLAATLSSQNLEAQTVYKEGKPVNPSALPVEMKVPEGMAEVSDTMSMDELDQLITKYEADLENALVRRDQAGANSRNANNSDIDRVAAGGDADRLRHLTVALSNKLEYLYNKKEQRGTLVVKDK